MNLIREASEALKRIEKNDFTPPDTAGVEGYSGAKLISALHALTSIFAGKERAYLELGVFRGLTLISNAKANHETACFGIDNFSLFDPEKKNLSIVEGHIDRLKLKNAHIINQDFDEALDNLPGYIGNKKIGVYFVDGPHDYRSQLVPLLKIVPYLAEECAIFVDDANYPHVRQATNDFLKTHPDFVLLAEAYTPKHIANMNPNEKEKAIAGWWDGVNIMVRDPKKTIQRTFAKEDKKELYPLSHEVFRHELADISIDIMKLAAELPKSTEKEKIVSQIEDLITKHRNENPNLFPHQNTYSDELPRFKIHFGE